MAGGLREARLELRVAAALGVTGLLALAGCGGGGTETVTQIKTQGTTPLPKPEFIAQQDAICGRYQAQGKGLLGENGEKLNDALSRRDNERAADLAKQSLDLLHQQQVEMNAVPAPAGDEEVVRKIEDQRSVTVGLWDRLTDAIESEDSGRIRALAGELNSATDTLDGLDTGFGFKVCGQD
jgi:hypothetical protein